MKHRRHIKIRSLRGLDACRGVRWRCDSRNACYGMYGKGHGIWDRLLLRAECARKCKAEVLMGRFMIGRKRGLDSMDEAKAWACERAARG